MYKVNDIKWKRLLAAQGRNQGWVANELKKLGIAGFATRLNAPGYMSEIMSGRYPLPDEAIGPIAEMTGYTVDAIRECFYSEEE